MNGNQISGFGINVADLDRSTEFYTRGLGLQEKGKYDLGHMHEVLIGSDADAVSILLIKHTARTEAPDIGTGYEKIVLVCDDVAAAYERGARRGWHVATGAPHHRTDGAHGRHGARPRRLPDRTGQADQLVPLASW